MIVKSFIPVDNLKISCCIVYVYRQLQKGIKMLNLIEQYQERFLKNFNTTYKRYLYNEINFSKKLIGIVGARGTGKTTMLFQKLIELKAQKQKGFIHKS